jgi:hypothetical protein
MRIEKQKLKEMAILFCIQILSYSLLCINFRAVAQTQYHTAAITDFALASMSFFVIRKIARSEDSFHQWTGYVLGSVAGSYLGIYISSLIH